MHPLEQRGVGGQLGNDRRDIDFARPRGIADASSRGMTALEVVLAGDVMTGRGIDQILPHPSSPELFEDYLRDARDYVELAERHSGPIARPVSFAYPWGEALAELRRADVRIVNLETSVTSSSDAWPDKGINYRMSPENVGCLTAARVDVAVLANNHVLDWGRAGLDETLAVLHAAGIRTAGAGHTREESESIATCAHGPRRVLVAAAAERGSGVPRSWQATDQAPGVVLLEDLDDDEAKAIAARLDLVRRAGDVAIVSLHWGGNWGYEVEPEHVRFAHALVEHGVDVVFGHSSHHARPIELFRGKPILYGCGDLLDDYEGIRGYEAFRQDLVLLYSLRFGKGGIEVRMKPFRIERMRLVHATPEEVAFLEHAVDDCSRPFGTRIVRCGGALRAERASRDVV